METCANANDEYERWVGGRSWAGAEWVEGGLLRYKLLYVGILAIYVGIAYTYF